MDERDEYAIARESTMCPRCEARPGEPCRTVSGKPVGKYDHSPRVAPLLEAWRNGYRAGRDA